MLWEHTIGRAVGSLQTGKHLPHQAHTIHVLVTTPVFEQRKLVIGEGCRRGWVVHYLPPYLPPPRPPPEGFAGRSWFPNKVLPWKGPGGDGYTGPVPGREYIMVGSQSPSVNGMARSL